MYYLVADKRDLFITKDCDDSTCKTSQHVFVKFPFDTDPFAAETIVRALNNGA